MIFQPRLRIDFLNVTEAEGGLGRSLGGGGGSYENGGIGYQVADTGPVGWVNFWPGCSLVPKY